MVIRSYIPQDIAKVRGLLLDRSKRFQKKIGSPASMKVTCYKDDPHNVVFTFQKQYNYEVETKGDFCLLPASKTTKEFIM
ncbi:hypothetical protein BDF21DRAFT_415538 [Thamnidium elegans]|nr:hypothetical protein BDF21DRAFT_415538 [Thamnidium elegans]